MVIYLKLKIDFKEFKEDLFLFLYKYSSLSLKELQGINITLKNIQRRLEDVTISLY